MSEVTQLLEAMKVGEPQAAEQLLPLVYQELRKLAAAQMAQEKPGQTLQATALVHEAYLRLVGPADREPRGRVSRPLTPRLTASRYPLPPHTPPACRRHASHWRVQSSRDGPRAVTATDSAPPLASRSRSCRRHGSR